MIILQKLLVLWRGCCILRSHWCPHFFPRSSYCSHKWETLRHFAYSFVFSNTIMVRKHLYGRHYNKVNGDKLNSLATSLFLIICTTHYRTAHAQTGRNLRHQCIQGMCNNQGLTDRPLQNIFAPLQKSIWVYWKTTKNPIGLCCFLEDALILPPFFVSS